VSVEFGAVATFPPGRSIWKDDLPRRLPARQTTASRPNSGIELFLLVVALLGAGMQTSPDKKARFHPYARHIYWGDKTRPRFPFFSLPDNQYKNEARQWCVKLIR
jgi:hypothetical protein